MNYIINTKDFINALKCVMKSYNPKNSVVTLQDLMIHTTQNQLELYGTTNEITTKRIIKADLNSTDFKELKICFDPQKMLKGLKLFKEPTTDITIDDKDLFVTLSNGNRNFKVNFSIIKDKEEDSLYESMFGHFVPSYTSDNKCLSYLLERYNSIEFATSKTDARPTLQGINFKENKMCAMDGYILALSEDNSENALVIEGDITIPKDVFVILNNCTKDEIHYKFITDDKHKFVGIKTFDKNDNMITNIVTRIYQGEYFSYETAFPNTHTSDITLKTKPMLDDIKYLNQIQDSKNKMPLHWFKKHLDIEYGSIDIQNSTIINENNVDEIHIGLNIGYLFNIVQHIKTDSFKAEFDNNVKPIVIRTVDSDDYNNLSFLQCPIRISKEKGWEY